MPPAPTHAPLFGIYCKLGSLVLFCTMDAMVKSLGGIYGPLQLALFRSTIAFVPLAVVIWRLKDARAMGVFDKPPRDRTAEK